MAIKIGNNNKIKNTNIGHNYNSSPPKGNFFTKHPFLSGLLISLIAGFIMLFSFWENIIKWLEDFIN